VTCTWGWLHRAPTQIGRQMRYSRGKVVVSLGFLAFVTALGLPRRRMVMEMVFRSGILALRSPRVLNITATAALLTYATRRFGGRLGKKIGVIFSVFFSAVWIIYYRYCVREVPTVKYVRTLWNRMIVEKSRLQKAVFSPTIWAYNRHAQTIICLAVSSLEFLFDHPIEFERERVPSFDAMANNTQKIHWASMAHHRTETTQSPRPVIVIVHGFGDNRFHPYVQRICRSCLHSGWRPVVWSYWRFDFGEHRDLESVLYFIQRRNPMAPLLAVAYSAGGHLLLKYLQAMGKKTPLVAAISCSGCFDLPYTIENIKRNENVSYRLYLDQQAEVCARRHMANDNRIDKELFSKFLDEEHDCERIYDMTLFSLPTYSYKNETLHESYPSYQFKRQTADHYANQASKFMDNVQITTLVLHAQDDPIVSGDHIDWEQAEANRFIITMRTRRGGHVAWYEGLLPFGETWCDRVCCRFISGVLEAHSQTNFIVDVVRRMQKLEGRQEDSKTIMTSAAEGGSGPSAIARICSASDVRGWAYAAMS